MIEYRVSSESWKSVCNLSYSKMKGRFSVYGLKSSNLSDCYYWDSSSGGGSVSIADRLSSDKRGVFGGWDTVGSVYVCFNLGAS